MFFVRKAKYDLLKEEINILNQDKKKLSNQKKLLEDKLEVLVKEIRIQDKMLNQLDKFKEKYIKSATSRGGLIKVRNRLSKRNTLLEEENKYYIKKLKKEEKISELKSNTITELCKKNKEYSEQITKLQGIVTNLNDLLSKRMRPRPTVQDITNYDKKAPIKK